MTTSTTVSASASSTNNGVLEIRFHQDSRELSLVMDTEGAHYPLSTFITLQTLDMSSLT